MVSSADTVSHRFRCPKQRGNRQHNTSNNMKCRATPSVSDKNMTTRSGAFFVAATNDPIWSFLLGRSRFTNNLKCCIVRFLGISTIENCQTHAVREKVVQVFKRIQGSERVNIQCFPSLLLTRRLHAMCSKRKRRTHSSIPPTPVDLSDHLQTLCPSQYKKKSQGTTCSRDGGELGATLFSAYLWLRASQGKLSLLIALSPPLREGSPVSTCTLAVIVFVYTVAADVQCLFTPQKGFCRHR